jgi:hypothetical protein
VWFVAVVAHEVNFYTGDESGAGTDAQVFIKLFGIGGATSEMQVEKLGDRFERNRNDLVKVSSGGDARLFIEYKTRPPNTFTCTMCILVN